MDETMLGKTLKITTIYEKGFIAISHLLHIKKTRLFVFSIEKHPVDYKLVNGKKGVPGHSCEIV
jgi:hypothetical protein